MTIKLFNSLNRELEGFQPINPKLVKMYVCGPTVYDFIHIGNARPIVVFDVLFRLLKQNYPEVLYVRNITDVDDKIINRAQEEQCSVSDLTKKNIDFYHQDIRQLNVLSPTFEPLATESIAGMLNMIQTLIDLNHAYVSQGHVYFSVESSDMYGKLSNRKLVEMRAGSRVKVADNKRHSMDFVLWKPSKQEQPSWDSPWGKGRPGWHIECSAMAKQYLGDQIDIHGGGEDLRFPHHENERIQSCCANQTNELANYWLHNGYITVQGEKMSKSIGNTYKLRDLLAKYPAEVIRYNLLSTHYRKPLEWNGSAIKRSFEFMNRLYDAFRRYNFLTTAVNLNCDLPKAVQKEVDSFFEILKKDLNTPLALQKLQHMLSELHKVKTGKKEWAKAIKIVANSLGILQCPLEQWFSRSEGNTNFDVEALVQERLQAKRNKEYQRSDEIRDFLESQGIILEDTADSTTWYQGVQKN